MGWKIIVKPLVQTISCPHCNKKITLDEALTHPIQEKIRKQFEAEFREQEAELSSKIKKVQTELDKKDKQLESLKESVEEQIEEAVKSKQQQIEKEAKKKAKDSIQVELNDLQEQLKEKDERLKKAQEEELKIRKERRQLEQAKEDFEAEMQRKYDEMRKQVYEEASKKIAEEHQLKDREKQKQIEDLNKEIAELKRKAEQGSQQLQGEIFELELEDILKENFVHDVFEPTVPGTKGADILQKVCSKKGQICGTILFEFKQAKNWSSSWISKLKNDQRGAKADIGIIVTTVLPSGVSNFAFMDGIVVVDFRFVVPVTLLLRQQLLEVARAKTFNTGRNEKMEFMYNYLTGTEFRQKVESVAEAFANMTKDLQKEKVAMTKTWAKREKQIQQAFYGIAGMYGDMQGIIGSSLPEIKSLDMPRMLIESDSDKEENSEKK